MNSCPCTVCGEGGHHPRACPTLCAPLKSGFYAPPAGHRPSGDDDDEHVKLNMWLTGLSTTNQSCQILLKRTASTRSVLGTVLPMKL